MIKKETKIQAKLIKKEQPKVDFRIGNSLLHDNIADLIKRSNYKLTKDFRDDGQEGLPIIMEYKNDLNILDIDSKLKLAGIDWNDMIDLFIEQNTLQKNLTRSIMDLENATRDFILWLKLTWPPINDVVIDLAQAKRLAQAFAQHLLNIKTRRPQFYTPALQEALDSGKVNYKIIEGNYIYEWYITNGIAKLKRTVNGIPTINLRLFIGNTFNKAFKETKDIHEAFLKCIPSIWLFTNVYKTNEADIINFLNGDFSTRKQGEQNV